MKIGYLGAGTWGFCLASLLASKGYSVVVWDIRSDLIKLLIEKKQHPQLPKCKCLGDVRFVYDYERHYKILIC